MELQDGGRVRRGDHLPPHKYIRNTSTCGTTPTEHWQKNSDLPKGKKIPTHLGGAKEKTETKEQGRDLHQWEGAVKEERFPHTRKPLRGQRLWVAEGGSFGATEESAATGVRRAKRRDSRTEARLGAQQHSPARGACLLTRWGGRGWEPRP